MICACNENISRDEHVDQVHSTQKWFGQFHIQVSYLEVRKNPVKKQVWT